MSDEDSLPEESQQPYAKVKAIRIAAEVVRAPTTDYSYAAPCSWSLYSIMATNTFGHTAFAAALEAAVTPNPDAGSCMMTQITKSRENPC
jgi:hypothetical protein